MNLISFAESIRIIRERAKKLQRSAERVAVRSALNRVLSRAVYALQPNPTHPVAAMDGIAAYHPSLTKVPARLQPHQWERINTGEPAPDRFDVVIRIEDVQWDGEVPIIDKAVECRQNIRWTGEDFDSGSFLFAQDHILQPQDLSLLLCAGYEEVEVYRRPVVTFVPTGSELILHAFQREPGKVLESNSAMTSGMVESWGGILRLTDPVADDRDALTQSLKSALEKSDVIVVSAGTSMGTRDLTFDVLSSMGSVLFHGVAMSPAKPVLYAEIGDVPVLGLPGYPVAAFLASHHYLRPLICTLSGVEVEIPQTVLISAEDLPAREMDYFYRVNMFDVDGQVFVRKISKGAGSVRSLSDMDGWMHVPPKTPIRKRDGVRVDVVSDRAKNSLAVCGTSDPAVAKLFDFFQERAPSHRVLFWEFPSHEALLNVAERNAHMAIIMTQAGAPDIFPEFAAQLQETMLRYRIFTRTTDEAQEHFDLVISENHLEFPPIRKLIHLLLSEEYRIWIGTQKGYHTGSKGLLEEIHDW